MLVGLSVSAISCSAYWLMDCSTAEFLSSGLLFVCFFVPVMYGVSVLPVLALLFFITHSSLKKSKLSHSARCIWLLSPSLIASALFLGAGFYSTIPTARFKAHICDPIPPSVKNIEAYGFSASRVSRWLLSFNIEEKGIETIVNEHGLKPIEGIDLEDLVESDYSLNWRSDFMEHFPKLPDSQCYGKVAPDYQIPSLDLYFVTDGSKAYFFSTYND